MAVDLAGLRCTEDFENVDEAATVAFDDVGGCFVDDGNFGDDDKNGDCSSSRSVAAKPLSFPFFRFKLWSNRIEPLSADNSVRWWWWMLDDIRADVVVDCLNTVATFISLRLVSFRSVPFLCFALFCCSMPVCVRECVCLRPFDCCARLKW